MLKKFALIIAVTAGVSLAAGAARAQELGLTPSHVVSLWTNVNAALITVAEVSSGDAAWAAELAATTPTRFDNKKPADVLARVVEFRAKLDRLLAAGGLKPAKQYQHGGGKVTPSVVFLNSGHTLDAVVRWVIQNTPRERLVSEYFTRHAISGKTPSDAFAMVDLANRRIDRILAKTSS